MMKKLILSCKKATYLISLKEESKLSFTQKLQLRAHLTVCSMCTLFEKQTAFITRNARHAHNHTTAALSDDAKGKMRKLVAEITSGE